MENRENRKTIQKSRHWKEQALMMAVGDIITIMAAYFLALLLRFDFTFSEIEPRFVDGFIRIIGPWCLVTLVVFYLCHLYHSIWSLASTKELISILKAYLILLPVYLVLRRVLDIFMPRSFYVMGFILNLSSL